MTGSGYDIVPITLDDAGIARITALLRLVFPKAAHFTEQVIRWQYIANPDGHAVGFNAWRDEELAAHYVTIPLLAMVNGKEERGLLSLNTATHPAHQGKGLFTQLANATYAHAASHGFGFVIGVANANSTHGFTKKLGFQLVSPLKAMIGVGPLKQAFGNRSGFEHIWHADAMRWRLSHPLNRYGVLRTAHMDLITTERTQFGARYLLAAMPKNAVPDAAIPRSTASSFFKIWIGLDNGLSFSGRPFLNIPMRFRPSPLNLIFKDLTGAGRTLDPKDVRFQAIDFDTL